MFSPKLKREIAEYIQQLLAETNHPELPDGEIKFLLHVDGAKSNRAFSGSTVRIESPKPSCDTMIDK